MNKKKKKEKAKILLREGIELMRKKEVGGLMDKFTSQLNGLAKARRAFELDDTLYEAYPLMFIFYTQFSQYSKPDENELNSLFKKWKTNFPEDPIPYLGMGRMLYNKGSNQQAFNELKIAEKLCAKKHDVSDGIKFDLYTLYAQLARDMGQYRKSINLLMKAKELNPEDLKIRLKLAGLFTTQNKVEESLKELEYVNKDDKGWKIPLQYFMLAEIFLASGNKKSAKVLFNVFLERYYCYDISEQEEEIYKRMVNHAEQISVEIKEINKGMWIRDMGLKDEIRIGDMRYEVMWDENGVTIGDKEFRW